MLSHCKVQNINVLFEVNDSSLRIFLGIVEVTKKLSHFVGNGGVSNGDWPHCAKGRSR